MSYILVGSRLTRGCWESWIDKRKCLESVIKLPCGGRGTQRPDQQRITHAKTRSEGQDQQQRGRKSRSGNIDQVPFNESEWAVNALHHLLQHPDLRFGISALLVDTLLGCLPKPLDSWFVHLPMNQGIAHSSLALVHFCRDCQEQKTKRNQECFAELMNERNGPSLASQKCTGGENTEFF